MAKTVVIVGGVAGGASLARVWACSGEGMFRGRGRI